MFRYRLCISMLMGVLFLMGLQHIDASDLVKTTTTSLKTDADGVVITETNQETVQAGQPVGRIQQLSDGVRTRLGNSYNSLNQYSGGKLDSVKNTAVNGFNGVLERVRSRKLTNSPSNVDAKSTACVLPPQTTETVVVTTKNTQP